MKESLLEKSICKYAEEKGMLSIKITSQYSRGWPDRVFHTPEGVTFYIEFKQEGKRPTKLQSHRHTELIRRKIDVYVVSTLAEGKTIVNYKCAR